MEKIITPLAAATARENCSLWAYACHSTRGKCVFNNTCLFPCARIVYSTWVLARLINASQLRLTILVDPALRLIWYSDFST